MNHPALTITTPSPPSLPPEPSPSPTNPLSFKPLPSTVSYTSSISRLCHAGDLSGAATELTRMRLAGADPNHVTLITLLSGVAHHPSGNYPFGASLHAYAVKLGLDSGNVKVGTAIVDMYSKLGHVGMARRRFGEMGVRNSMSWNSMIDGYMRCGRVEDAVYLFDEMPQWDVVSWTVLISGFVKMGLYEEALDWFREMQLSGVEPDHVTVVAVIAACANLGALGLGLWIHRYAVGRGFNGNVRVGNSFIDMYCRCGCVEFAREVFDGMEIRSVVSWNSIINGFASNGRVDEALRYFDLMQEEGFRPDGVSFTGALSACSHAGLVDEGLGLFDQMRRKNFIRPRIEHYGCLVDLYSRAGRLRDALNVIAEMPMEPNEVVLGSLLAACRDCDDVQLAEMLMNYIAELAPDCDSNYVMLANMHAAAGRWEGSGKVRRKMKAHGIQKTPGISIIEIGDSVHEFVSGDKSHSEAESICAMLDLISLELMVYGYIPQSVSSEA